mmetsp:Transcript_16463/g.14189  ORF Transcript_16463/g.14189 Transcript_16463/m.14189 type:complete len:274 (-) Transcript_16463:1074-1895(-)
MTPMKWELSLQVRSERTATSVKVLPLNSLSNHVLRLSQSTDTGTRHGVITSTQLMSRKSVLKLKGTLATMVSFLKVSWVMPLLKALETLFPFTDTSRVALVIISTPQTSKKSALVSRVSLETLVMSLKELASMLLNLSRMIMKSRNALLMVMSMMRLFLFTDTGMLLTLTISTPRMAMKSEQLHLVKLDNMATSQKALVSTFSRTIVKAPSPFTDIGTKLGEIISIPPIVRKLEPLPQEPKEIMDLSMKVFWVMLFLKMLVAPSQSTDTSRVE